MTSPLTGDRLQPGTLGAATLRSRQPFSRSLALKRMQRGVARQWVIVLAAFLIVTALGVAYDLSGGVRIVPAILFWLPVGLAVSLGIGLVRELGRNTVTSLSSLGKHRGYAILGAAPEVTERTMRQLPPQHRTPLGCLTFQPASPFSTAFRDLQSSLSDAGLVAFIGAMPDDGATTSALGAAASAAQQGRSVVLVDCDIRRRSLTRALECDAPTGVLELCDQPADWQSFIEEEPETGLHFLPAGRGRNLWRSLIGAPGFPLLLEQLRGAYDLVVLDCPPAFGSADGALIAQLAEKCVVVAAWDRTPLTAVRRTVGALRRRSRVTTGVYVNRVPPGYRFGRLRPD